VIDELAPISCRRVMCCDRHVCVCVGLSLFPGLIAARRTGRLRGTKKIEEEVEAK